ncbi:Rieske (2Fe-2S) protein [Pseudonocardia sp.]|uniref:Rieske (2Fe-2S) protein n=1 Tax=Pseudonocardia sp. TaxID=60912 RepID=UPI003D0ADDFC
MPPTDEPAATDIPPGSPASRLLSRRAVVAGAGAAAIGAGLLVAGCSADPGSDSGAGAGSGSGSGGGSGSGSGSGGSASGTLGPATDVPVGGAKIYGDQGVVVTQPTAGNYAGFSTRCPHQGCQVNEIDGASIICPCHGSMFALDGAVEQGPARTGLVQKAVTVENGQIVLS